jgi:hypothetical protein
MESIDSCGRLPRPPADTILPFRRSGGRKIDSVSRTESVIQNNFNHRALRCSKRTERFCAQAGVLPT